MYGRKFIAGGIIVVVPWHFSGATVFRKGQTIWSSIWGITYRQLGYPIGNSRYFSLSPSLRSTLPPQIFPAKNILAAAYLNRMPIMVARAWGNAKSTVVPTRSRDGKWKIRMKNCRYLREAENYYRFEGISDQSALF